MFSIDKRKKSIPYTQKDSVVFINILGRNGAGEAGVVRAEGDKQKSRAWQFSRLAFEYLHVSALPRELSIAYAP